MYMQVYQIGRHIIQLHYPTQQDLYDAGNRFHVFYEHPLHKGSFQQDDGNWSGYNFPPRFFFSLNEDLSEVEQQVYNLGLRYPSSYFIMTYENPSVDRTLIHETAHALYKTDPSYKQEVDYLLKDKDLDTLKGILPKYDNSVILDEIQAYLVEWKKIRINLLKSGINPDQYLQLHLDIQRIYHRYAANLRKTAI
jgi:hypothetical protein